jgi:chromosome segregation ATPase
MSDKTGANPYQTIISLKARIAELEIEAAKERSLAEQATRARNTAQAKVRELEAELEDWRKQDDEVSGQTEYWKARAEKAEALIAKMEHGCVWKPEAERLAAELDKTGTSHDPCNHTIRRLEARIAELETKLAGHYAGTDCTFLERERCNCEHGPWYDINGKRTVPAREREPTP